MTRTGPDTDLRDFTVALLSGAGPEPLRYPLDELEFRERCLRYWRQQRVAPLLARIVVREPGFPHEWRPWASQEISANAVVSLQHLERIVALAKLLHDEAGIEAMPLKGVVLSLLLYGDPGLRQCGDIDLLVQPERLDEAIPLLLAHGYRPRIPHHFTPDGRMKPSYRRFRHEVGLVHMSGSHIVEAHHRLNGIRGLLPEHLDVLRARAVAVNVGGLEVYVPGPDHLLGYLAVHAMLSRWSTMKWLYDLPFVIDRFGEDVVDAAYRQAANAGFTPLLDAALSLSARLTGRDIPACRGSGKRNKALVDAVWRRLADGRYAVENRRDPLQLAAFRIKLLEGVRPRARLVECNLRMVVEI